MIPVWIIVVIILFYLLVGILTCAGFKCIAGRHFGEPAGMPIVVGVLVWPLAFLFIIEEAFIIVIDALAKVCTKVKDNLANKMRED